ncbi:hypothetical protein GCM10010124_35810 [Pilimelia terevasa]|uniref:Arsenate reductase n=1 Tax=Pilimelia terevasa TaxID=53372 RepID=A0A8J3BUN0_9ACTN|nr:hypothetical protein GCM10010124_35810 [Pilimelia terevasa]
MVTMWDNPACAKCATAREALAAAGVPVHLRAYLTSPPTAAELADVLARLGAGPWEICRLGEPAAAALGLADWGRTPADVPRWLAAMAAHPELIQRPIIVADDGTARVARGAEALAEAVRRAAGTRDADPLVRRPARAADGLGPGG